MSTNCATCDNNVNVNVNRVHRQYIPPQATYVQNRAVQQQVDNYQTRINQILQAKTIAAQQLNNPNVIRVRR